MKYGYKMFDCTLDQWKQFIDHSYDVKKVPDPENKFSYVQFQNCEEAISRIRSVFVPKSHGNLPKVKWTLTDRNTLLVKEIEFVTNEHSLLYQKAVERAWALGGHLDKRVKQIFYD